MLHASASRERLARQHVRHRGESALRGFGGLQEFPPSDQQAQKIIKASTIGYDFQFVITETNDTGMGKLQFNRPSVRDASKGFTLDVTANAHKERTNTRRFRIVEDLSEVYAADCSHATTRRNWVYPITGATGMAEVVRTFIKLEKLSHLAPLPTTLDDGTSVAFAGTGNKSVVFADVLKFHTILSVGVQPTLLLSAVPGHLKLTNASSLQPLATAKRDDAHDVIVALASDLKVVDRLDRPTSSLARKIAVARVKREELIKMDVVPDPRSLTALVQKNADARNRVLIELQRLRNLEDDDNEAPRVLGQRLLDLMRVP